MIQAQREQLATHSGEEESIYGLLNDAQVYIFHKIVLPFSVKCFCVYILVWEFN